MADRLPQILDGVQQNLVEKQIVDVPASKILVVIVDPVAYRRQATARVDVHFRVPQIQEQIVEVIEVILQEQCQRMCLFTFERRVVQQLFDWCFLEGCGSLAKAPATARVDVPTTPKSTLLR